MGGLGVRVWGVGCGVWGRTIATDPLSIVHFPFTPPLLPLLPLPHRTRLAKLKREPLCRLGSESR